MPKLDSPATLVGSRLLRGLLALGLLASSGLAHADRFAALPVPPPPPMIQPAPVPAAPIVVAPPPVVTNLPPDRGTFPSNGVFALQNAGASPPALSPQGGPPIPLTLVARDGWLIAVPSQVLAFGALHTLEVSGPSGSELYTFMAGLPCPLDFTEIELTAQLHTYETYGPGDVCCPAAGSMPAFCSSATRVQLPQITVEAAPGVAPTALMCLTQYWFREPGAGPQPAWLPGGPTRSFPEASDQYCASFEIERLRDGMRQLREVCVPHGTLVLESREVAPSLPHRACSAPPAGFEDAFCMQNSAECNGLNPPATCEPHRDLCSWPAAQVFPTPTIPPPTPPAPNPFDDTVGPPPGTAGSGAPGGASGSAAASQRPTDGALATEEEVPPQSCGCRAVGSGRVTRSKLALAGLLALFALRRRRAR
jgi:hypothetical protein